MINIDNEIEDLAEKMAKSTTTEDESLASLQKTVLELGPEGIKKAIPLLSDDQKRLLTEVMEKMRKSSIEIVEPYNNPLEVSNDDVDEFLAATAPSTVRNQGGVPIEGWRGQVIGEEPTDAEMWAEKELEALIG